ncbi:MAG TPA: hypothetical protein VNK04_06560 [Gemmataceae bacterium]|nr:hypothetical protein [Gemmataceae bacterium]
MFRSLLGVTAVVLLFPAVAEAHLFRSLFGPRTVTAYYYPVVVPALAPVRVYYAAPAPVVVSYTPCPIPVAPAVAVPATPVVPSTPAPPLATPQPAPPSPAPSAAPTSPAPAPGPGMASGVGERRFYDAYAAGVRDPARAAFGRASVGFWNLSGRDLVLLAGGQRLLLPNGRNVTLELDRQFSWQVEGRPAMVEQVPANESAMEIVIRQ